MTEDTPLEQLHDTAELARKLHVSERTPEKWRTDGTGPAYIKLGKRVLYRESAIQRWLDARTLTHTADPGKPALLKKQRSRR